jgi:hypothetical protein
VVCSQISERAGVCAGGRRRAPRGTPVTVSRRGGGSGGPGDGGGPGGDGEGGGAGGDGEGGGPGGDGCSRDGGCSCDMLRESTQPAAAGWII